MAAPAAPVAFINSVYFNRVDRPQNPAPQGIVQTAALAGKKALATVAHYTDQISDTMGLFRHFAQILPAVELYLGRPGLFQATIGVIKNATVISDNLEPINDFNGVNGAIRNEYNTGKKYALWARVPLAVANILSNSGVQLLAHKTFRAVALTSDYIPPFVLTAINNIANSEAANYATFYVPGRAKEFALNARGYVKSLPLGECVNFAATLGFGGYFLLASIQSYKNLDGSRRARAALGQNLAKLANVVGVGLMKTNSTYGVAFYGAFAAAAVTYNTYCKKCA